jgi:hypothetical protein
MLRINSPAPTTSTRPSPPPPSSLASRTHQGILISSRLGVVSDGVFILGPSSAHPASSLDVPVHLFAYQGDLGNLTTLG